MVKDEAVPNLAESMAWLERNQPPAGKIAVFRGHPDAAFDLRPSVFRKEIVPA